MNHWGTMAEWHFTVPRLAGCRVCTRRRNRFGAAAPQLTFDLGNLFSRFSDDPYNVDTPGSLRATPSCSDVTNASFQPPPVRVVPSAAT